MLVGAGAGESLAAILPPVSQPHSPTIPRSHIFSPVDKFARNMGVPLVPDDELVSEAARQQFEMIRGYSPGVQQLFNNQQAHDTVGAVALDAHGNVAAATSTGGITAKMAGRVGDSPLPGAGGFADNALGAVSTTGHGESIIKVLLARGVLSALDRPVVDGDRGCGSSSSAANATFMELAAMQERVQGCGGAICVSRDGTPGFWHTTEQMPWAVQQSGSEILSGMNLHDAKGSNLTVR